MNADVFTAIESAKDLGMTLGAVRLAIFDKRLSYQEFYGRRLIARANLDFYKQRAQIEGVKKVGRLCKEIEVAER